MARLVIAPDSFKGTATAARAAAAVARGWNAVRPGDELVIVPMADGGEGTLDAFDTAIPGCVSHEISVTGPAPGAPPVAARWLELPAAPGRAHRTAVVELAAVAGFGLSGGPRPLTAHTFGVGEAIAAALSSGVDQLLVALGGSCSTDGGAGALAALGARITDARGDDIGRGGAALAAATRWDRSRLPALPARGVRLLTDVTNPLLGPDGAAAVFGPQKGASAADVRVLEVGLGTWAHVVGLDATLPGVGAAGGTAYGLLAWGAEVVSGAETVSAAVGLPALIASADAVVTGEGSFDSQTAAGKAPGVVLDAARAAGTRALVVAGRIDVRPTGVVCCSLTELAGSTRAALADAERWLERAGRRLAAAYAASCAEGCADGSEGSEAD